MHDTELTQDELTQDKLTQDELDAGAALTADPARNRAAEMATRAAPPKPAPIKVERGQGVLRLTLALALIAASGAYTVLTSEGGIGGRADAPVKPQIIRLDSQRRGG